MLPALKVYQIHSATLESGVLENQKVLKHLARIKKETGLLIGLTSSGKGIGEFGAIGTVVGILFCLIIAFSMIQKRK